MEYKFLDGLGTNVEEVPPVKNFRRALSRYRASWRASSWLRDAACCTLSHCMEVSSRIGDLSQVPFPMPLIASMKCWASVHMASLRLYRLLILPLLDLDFLGGVILGTGSNQSSQSMSSASSCGEGNKPGASVRCVVAACRRNSVAEAPTGSSLWSERWCHPCGWPPPFLGVYLGWPPLGFGPLPPPPLPPPP